MENKEFVVQNIRDFLSRGEGGEHWLRHVLSTFSCKRNIDVERFLKEQAIDFTKKNQSVTYTVFTPDYADLIGYFTITIKPISVNGEAFSNTVKRKIARVSEQNPENGNYSLSAYLVAQLGKNFNNDVNKLITGEQLLGLAIDKIEEMQYMAGGMVVFLEAENEEKLLEFYEANRFKRFDTKETQSGTKGTHTLVQLLKVL